ncbi:MAG: phosphate ABC transporter permease PstA [Parvularculaceae bacterium]|jgi:phosphate transport system permease protein|nr:phosphate ABC transporter permease PstA [Parvularculaceae bacterium]
MSRKSQRRRRFAERAFRAVATGALVFAAGMFLLLCAGIAALGAEAFLRHEARLEIALDAAVLGVSAQASAAELGTADFRAAVRRAVAEAAAPAADTVSEIELNALISPGAEFALADALSRNSGLLGRSITIDAPLSDAADRYLKESPDARGYARLSAAQQDVIAALKAKGRLSRAFNADFFASGDSSYPELAGVAAGFVGSMFSVGVAILIALPLGVATAVFLEEFAPKNALVDFLEININNLAAVPSIIFGLLGLVVFIIALGMPRSAPIVGGLVLALMTLPTIIIVTRSSLQALPSSLKEGALALGASKLDAVLNPLLPAAAPGIATGVIIGVARALGETAPLILIGMVAFVATPPLNPLEPSSALPVLVYLWAESPETAFAEKTAGAIILLLVLLIVLNGLAAAIRRRANVYRR